MTNVITIKKIRKRILVIIAFSLCWNVMLPGIIAYVDNVFYKNDMEKKLPKHSKTTLQSYQKYTQSKISYINKIAIVDSQINVAINNENRNLQALLNLRNDYNGELTKLNSPIIVSAFYNNRSVYYTLIAYIILCILLIIMPTRLRRVKATQNFALGIMLYIGWMFTSWMRNFIFFDEGRTIFSYVNFDISPVSFVFQELRTLGMCFLISTLWRGWDLYISDSYKAILNWRNQPNNLQKLTNYAVIVSRMFRFWQLNSIFVIVAFLPWTIFYWTNVIEMGDSRYVIPAIIMHLYWAITWVLISIPVIIAYNKWTNLKAKAIGTTARQLSTELDHTLNLLKEINPLTTLQIFGSGIISLFSFIYPLLDVFK